MGTNRPLLSRGSPLIASLLVAALQPAAAGSRAMRNVASWASLHSLCGAGISVADLIGRLRDLHRDETFFTLARIAADIANADGGPLGEEARGWTYDLIKRFTGSANPNEAALARAVVRAGPNVPIAHAQVIFLLQVMSLVCGSVQGTVPRDGYLSFLMLAANDHLDEWFRPSPELSEIEATLTSMFLMSIFNRGDDMLRVITRLLGIFEMAPQHGPISADQWRDIEREAFGCTFAEYAESFLIPLLLLSKRWGAETPPVVHRENWARCTIDPSLVDRWLREASLPIASAVKEFASRPMPRGLYGVPPIFLRTALIQFEQGYVGPSPWHIRDHVSLGTWAKLNAAAKRVLATKDIQRFASAFGYMFEEWCRRTAADAAREPGFKGTLVLPTFPGADDEIEDVVIVERDVAVLMSAKSSLVPEAALKGAESAADVMKWLKRFFFEDRDQARQHGHRGGAVTLLDRRIQQVRAGQFESQGVSRNATIVPVVISFDNVGESGVLYKWLEEGCASAGVLSARAGVRPLTILDPGNFEGLLALAARGRSIVDLLLAKTSAVEKWGVVDHFLFTVEPDAMQHRLPSIEDSFEATVARVQRWFAR